MSSLELRNRDRAIEELRIFLKKIFVEPEIISHSLAITRDLIDEENADAIQAWSRRKDRDWTAVHKLDSTG